MVKLFAYSDLFLLLPFNLMLVNTDSPIFTILNVTDEHCNVLGSKREDIIGKGLFEVYPESTEKNYDNRPVLKSINNVLKTKEIDRMPHIRYDIEGGERYFAVSSHPILDKGQVVMVLIYTIDLTEIEKINCSIKNG